MWTPATRRQHSRKALRYRTDLTDAEWVVIEPHLPPAHGTGRPFLASRRRQDVQDWKEQAQRKPLTWRGLFGGRGTGVDA